VTASGSLTSTGVDAQAAVILDYGTPAQSVLTTSMLVDTPGRGLVSGTTAQVEFPTPAHCGEQVAGIVDLRKQGRLCPGTLRGAAAAGIGAQGRHPDRGERLGKPRQGSRPRAGSAWREPASVARRVVVAVAVARQPGGEEEDVGVATPGVVRLSVRQYERCTQGDVARPDAQLFGRRHERRVHAPRD